MHDLSLALAFCAMIILPCIVAMNQTPEED